MSKFKKGDKIRCIKDYCCDSRMKKGEIYTVSKINSMGHLLLEGFGNFSWGDKRFELVEESMFGKKEKFDNPDKLYLAQVVDTSRNKLILTNWYGKALGMIFVVRVRPSSLSISDGLEYEVANVEFNKQLQVPNHTSSSIIGNGFDTVDIKILGEYVEFPPAPSIFGFSNGITVRTEKGYHGIDVVTTDESPKFGRLSAESLSKIRAGMSGVSLDGFNVHSTGHIVVGCETFNRAEVEKFFEWYDKNRLTN